MKCLGFTWALGACVALFAASCQSTERARTSVQILPPRPSPNVTPQQDVKPSDSEIKIVYVPPRAKNVLVKPLLPTSVIRSGKRSEVVATIVVDDSGRVSSVQRSLADLSIPTQDSGGLLEAIVTATSAWEFEPARQVFWQKVSGQDDRYLYSEIVSARFDVRFVFARQN